MKRLRSWADGAPLEVEHIRGAADYIDTLAKRIALLEKLMADADDMWAFSVANPTRSTWDMEWNQKRLKLLGRKA